MAQLDKYPDVLQNDVEFLSQYSYFTRNVDYAGRMVYDEQGREVFNFGRYKGVPVAEVLQRDPGYYGWMMNGEFPLNTKQVLTRIKLRGIKR
jgi:DNA polymerase-3 subunit epsilon